MGAWAHGRMGAKRTKTRPATRPCPRAPMRPCGLQAAFTLVEVILAILVIAVGLTASMRALPVILQVSQATRESLVAQHLATDLLTEIALLPYEDPDGSPKFGTEDNETADTRAGFDDIDDYDNWAASPPQKKDGTQEPNSEGYTRSVLVQSVNEDDFTRLEGDSDTRPKRIIITVSKPGITPVVVTTVRLKGANREDLQ